MGIRSPSDSPKVRCCCGASPLGLRGLAQAQLQAVGMGNPGWMLSCLSWSLPGTHTHTYTQRDKCHVQAWTRLCLSEHKWRLRPRVMVRHLGPQSPSPGTLTVPLKKPQHHHPQLLQQLVQQKTKEHNPAKFQGSTRGHAGSTGQDIICTRSLRG